MTEYIVYESKSDEVTDYLGMKHSVSHIEKREEIVRCRDCENYEYREHVGRSYCCGEYATEPDGFCAWAKRKDGGMTNYEKLFN